jgi:hypothetical protein
MKLSAKHLFATLGMFTVIAVTPTSAFAKGSVHFDLPGLSIGVHDDHRSNSRHRKHYNNNHRSRYNDHYDNRRYERRHHRREHKRHYNKRHYNDNYNSRGRHDSQRYDRRNNSHRSDSYRVEVCPIDGYSRYFQQGRRGYQHKDHYHY